MSENFYLVKKYREFATRRSSKIFITQAQVRYSSSSYAFIIQRQNDNASIMTEEMDVKKMKGKDFPLLSLIESLDTFLANEMPLQCPTFATPLQNEACQPKA